ncbi:ABC transporter substrate-binding protein [Novisyntrophococcus fermenticellae]|uniref:ABC transporter substrate-binding protein n=1 Tax=Novisyntrophococcus fermenticellae TaxID=2068655 RepID=UPI001E287334|nr:ABC transporter substrate-binding protein [Novisyntrophococcus fermenticellae]
MKKKWTTGFLLMAMILSLLTGCGQKAEEVKKDDTKEASTQADESKGAQQSKYDGITEDRLGNPITLPDTIEKVLVAGPSNAEILVGLGYGDKIVAADVYSKNVEGLPDGIAMFDMTAPDVESILAVKPDVIFATAMVQTAGDDVYKPFRDAGICVIYIPSSNSIAEIKEDIRYIAAVMGDVSKSDPVIQEMESEISAIQEIGKTITDKKKVYFEIAAAPDMYSFGEGVFLNEMIEIIGAENILEDQKEWMSVSAESILESNPDVILTSVNYIDDPVSEIKSRPGWETLTAVKENAVYYIDTDASNNPSQHIVKALKEMAKAVYPDKY